MNLRYEAGMPIKRSVLGSPNEFAEQKKLKERLAQGEDQHVEVHGLQKKSQRGQRQLRNLNTFDINTLPSHGRDHNFD
jgi:hypothetical protein